MKNRNLRNTILGEDRFKQSHIVKPVPEKWAYAYANLASNHVVHAGKASNQNDLAHRMPGRELKGGRSSQ
jgi:hypothetical protein